eukprot:GHVN01050716.1.p1 GENE.GHVN01050716.1~~GHVN01050716.1.p1  ORF type:complete len:1302 (+),score=335.43 GHVN01050716.1:234-4139(+)
MVNSPSTSFQPIPISLDCYSPTYSPKSHSIVNVPLNEVPSIYPPSLFSTTPSTSPPETPPFHPGTPPEATKQITTVPPPRSPYMNCPREPSSCLHLVTPSTDSPIGMKRSHGAALELIWSPNNTTATVTHGATAQDGTSRPLDKVNDGPFSLPPSPECEQEEDAPRADTPLPSAVSSSFTVRPLQQITSPLAKHPLHDGGDVTDIATGTTNLSSLFSPPPETESGVDDVESGRSEVTHSDTRPQFCSPASTSDDTGEGKGYPLFDSKWGELQASSLSASPPSKADESTGTNDGRKRRYEVALGEGLSNKTSETFGLREKMKLHELVVDKGKDEGQVTGEGEGGHVDLDAEASGVNGEHEGEVADIDSSETPLDLLPTQLTQEVSSLTSPPTPTPCGWGSASEDGGGEVVVSQSQSVKEKRHRLSVSPHLIVDLINMLKQRQHRRRVLKSVRRCTHLVFTDELRPSEKNSPQSRTHFTHRPNQQQPRPHALLTTPSGSAVCSPATEGGDDQNGRQQQLCEQPEECKLGPYDRLEMGQPSLSGAPSVLSKTSEQTEIIEVSDDSTRTPKKGERRSVKMENGEGDTVCEVTGVCDDDAGEMFVNLEARQDPNTLQVRSPSPTNPHVSTPIPLKTSPHLRCSERLTSAPPPQSVHWSPHDLLTHHSTPTHAEWLRQSKQCVLKSSLSSPLTSLTSVTSSMTHPVKEITALEFERACLSRQGKLLFRSFTSLKWLELNSVNLPSRVAHWLFTACSRSLNILRVFDCGIYLPLTVNMVKVKRIVASCLFSALGWNLRCINCAELSLQSLVMTQDAEVLSDTVNDGTHLHVPSAIKYLEIGVCDISCLSMLCKRLTATSLEVLNIVTMYRQTWAPNDDEMEAGTASAGDSRPPSTIMPLSPSRRAARNAVRSALIFISSAFPHLKVAALGSLGGRLTENVDTCMRLHGFALHGIRSLAAMAASPQSPVLSDKPSMSSLSFLNADQPPSEWVAADPYLSLTSISAPASAIRWRHRSGDVVNAAASHLRGEVVSSTRVCGDKGGYAGDYKQSSQRECDLPQSLFSSTDCTPCPKESRSDFSSTSLSAVAFSHAMREVGETHGFFIPSQQRVYLRKTHTPSLFSISHTSAGASGLPKMPLLGDSVTDVQRLGVGFIGDANGEDCHILGEGVSPINQSTSSSSSEVGGQCRRGHRNTVSGVEHVGRGGRASIGFRENEGLTIQPPEGIEDGATHIEAPSSRATSLVIELDSAPPKPSSALIHIPSTITEVCSAAVKPVQVKEGGLPQPQSQGGGSFLKVRSGRRHTIAPGTL